MKYSLKKNIFFLLSFSMSGVVILSNYLVQFPFRYFNLETILTYGAFSYPIAFLITDLTNKTFGSIQAKKVVYFGFFTGVIISIILSIKQIDLIFYRIAIASGVAFLIAQLLDIKIFDKLKNRIWFIPPLVSSLISSTIDTFLFFSLAFFGSGVTWVTLAFGDLCVKFFITVLMLVPFRIILILFKRSSILKKI